VRLVAHLVTKVVVLVEGQVFLVVVGLLDTLALVGTVVMALVLMEARVQVAVVAVVVQIAGTKAAAVAE
jgi:hypothetical protein